MATSVPWKSRKTKEALWWVGAMQGMRMASTSEPRKCHAAEKVLIHASTLVLMVFTMPWIASTAAGHRSVLASTMTAPQLKGMASSMTDAA